MVAVEGEVVTDDTEDEVSSCAVKDETRRQEAVY